MNAGQLVSNLSLLVQSVQWVLSMDWHTSMVYIQIEKFYWTPFCNHRTSSVIFPMKDQIYLTITILSLIHCSFRCYEMKLWLILTTLWVLSHSFIFTAGSTADFPRQRVDALRKQSMFRQKGTIYLAFPNRKGIHYSKVLCFCC